MTKIKFDQKIWIWSDFFTQVWTPPFVDPKKDNFTLKIFINYLQKK